MTESPDSYASVADLYDHVAPYRTRPDVTFFVDEAKKAAGPVLEIGCGTGRVLIPTARAGARVVGLDASRGMLDVCRQRLAGEPPAVQGRARLVEGDMRDFALGETFALVTIPFRPFQHLLTVEDQLACLAAVRRHLADDGTFILDLFNPSLEFMVQQPLGVEFGDEPEFTTPDGRGVVRRQKRVAHDRARQIGEFELIYHVRHPDGGEERLVQAFPMRYLFRFEAEHLLARAGFAVEHLYADYERRPYGSVYPGELVFVARKSGAPAV
jgi:SAM-dependent methyltransferase